MTTEYKTAHNGTISISDTGAQMSLAADTALSYTVPGAPSQRYRALFAYPENAAVWVGINVTATIPSVGAINSTYNVEQVRPNQSRFVKGGDVLSFISLAAATDVGVTLQALLG